jgi:hypothetical protein
MDYGAYDEWEIKNLHCTPDEVDERQALELALILDQWQKGEIPPWEVLRLTADTVGASHCRILWDYQFYLPCATVEGARNYVQMTYERYNGVYGTASKSQDPQDIADATWSVRQKYQEALTTLKGRLRPEVLADGMPPLVHQAIDGIRDRLQSTEFTSWQAALAIAEVLSPSPDVQDLHDPSVLDDPLYLGFDNFSELIERSKQAVTAQAENISQTLNAFTPETEADIKKPLAAFFARRQARENARAAWVNETRAQYEAEHGICLSDLEAAWQARNDTAFKEYMARYTGEPNSTAELIYKLDFNNPEPLDPHLQRIQSLTASSEFRYSKAAHLFEKTKMDMSTPLIIPIDFPDRALCAGLEIVPSGTGLIQIYDKDPYHDWEPTSIARITTYSVSFLPKDPADLDLLRETIEKALSLLGTIPYKYRLAGWTSAGESYTRVSTNLENLIHNSENYASAYVVNQDGKLSPHARFDLDDVWLLYTLLEPIIEPNAQIAAAMNAARFAEERGAILTPDGDGIQQSHEVAEKSGYLKKSAPAAMLKDALWDSFVDLVLRTIDKAEFTARLSTLAHHTLTGEIRDPAGAFPTYDTLLSNARKGDGNHAIKAYDETLAERTLDLLRYILGEPKESSRPLSVALIAKVQDIEGALKEQSREQARQDQHDSYDSFLDRRRAWNANRPDVLGTMKRRIDEFFLFQEVSDMVAGKPFISDEDRAAKTKGAVSIMAQLVVASSAVETAIDGVHKAHVDWKWYYFKKGQRPGYHEDTPCPGTYLTRTKGSPYVRYELPESLTPFVAEHSHRPSHQLLLKLMGPSFR